MIALLACVALPIFFQTDLQELYRGRDFTWTHDTATGREILGLGSGRVVLSPSCDVVLVDGIPKTFGEPVRIQAGRIRIPADLAAEIERRAPLRGLKPSVEAPQPPITRSPGVPQFTVVIDAGHGGIYDGAIGNDTGLKEKEVTLAIATMAKDLLESRGARVIMTRTTDRELSTDWDTDLEQRASIANRVQPELFLSIHANTAADRSARGYEVWVPRSKNERGRASRRMAQLVRRELAANVESEDRGTKEKDFRVLARTECPAVLVEVEFLSNRRGERDLNNGGYRREVAEALSDAVLKYVGAGR